MWCPSCGAEYRPGFTHCPDCDTDLVAEPPSPATEPERQTERALRLERIARMGDLDRFGPNPASVYVGPPVEADQMKAVLEGSGIDCLVWHSGLEVAYGAIGPSRVVVTTEDAERAEEVILAARAGELDLDEVEGESPVAPTAEASPELDVAGVFAGSDRAAPARSAAGVPASPAPIREVTPWWRGPRSGAVFARLVIVVVMALVVGGAYWIMRLIGD